MAPTGAAAFNIGGETIHRTAGITVHHEDREPGPKALKRMTKKFQQTVALFIDERSMVSQKILGATERNVALAAHYGLHSKEDWGGIPIVIMLGDDMQLPPVIERGAFDMMATQLHDRKVNRTKQMPVEPNGYQQFLEFSKDVMELNGTKRTLNGQGEFVQTCNNIRNDTLSNSQADDLIDLHLTEMDTLTRQQKDAIRAKALHIFANVAPMQEHNYIRLAKTSTKNNPVALIKAIDRATNAKNKPKKTHLTNTKGRGDILPVATTICRGAKVQLSNNLQPEWGLYNGAIGTVKELVFQKDKNPNCGDQPSYVVVEFNQYPSDAPKWIVTKPKYIPIPPITFHCEKGCCTRTQLPLSLAFAKTGHTFQGQQAGPSKPGQPPNSADVIICDVGNRMFELRNPGTFYSQVTRATTWGDASRLNSAIYFDGPNLNKHRMMNMTRKKDGHPMEKVINRKRWMDLLHTNIQQCDLPVHERNDLLHWMTNTKISPQHMHKHIHSTTWRSNIS